MSDMEKNLNLSVIRKQIKGVTEVLSENDLLYPSRKYSEGEGGLIERELVQHLVKFEGLLFIRSLHYKNARINVQIQMTDVTTDGMKINMTPVIGFIQLVKSPFNNDNPEFYSIEKLCNKVAQEALVESNV